MERLWVRSLQGVDPSHNVSGFEMKPTPTMAAKALKNSEQCHSSCTICQSTSNCERNPRPAKVASDDVSCNVDLLWSRTRLPTLNHRNHDLGSFQFSFKLYKTLNSSVWCSLLKFSAGGATVPWEKSVQNLLKRLELFAQEFGSPWSHVRSDRPIMFCLKTSPRHCQWHQRNWQKSKTSSEFDRVHHFRASDVQQKLCIWNSIEAPSMAGSLPKNLPWKNVMLPHCQGTNSSIAHYGSAKECGSFKASRSQPTPQRHTLDTETYAAAKGLKPWHPTVG